MHISTSSWFLIFVSFMTAISYLRDYIDYNNSLAICIGFSMTYFMVYGVYRMMKILKYETSFYNLMITLLMLFLSTVSGNIYVKVYYSTESTSTHILFILCGFLGFGIGIKKCFTYMLLNDPNQPQQLNDEQQPLV